MSDVTSAKSCPVCGKPTSDRHKPFCSQRCSTIDLARWLTGGYRVAGEEVPREPPAEGEETQKD
ncbi:MAG TPA: DNA gyrase inhibitor YacG [Stellaceae bacterium]|nr:DNA gyrase inhibitor YacG [Stellaceae bacterium]HYC15213.1 DNA gyrase inhibitor YacG [Stellaceae bacterium]